MQTAAADMSTDAAATAAATGANGHLHHHRHNSVDTHSITDTSGYLGSDGSNGRLDEPGHIGAKAVRPDLVDANLHSSEEDMGLGTGDDEDAIEDEDDGDESGQLEFTPAVVTTPLDEVPSLASSTTFTGWGPPTGTSIATRSRGSMTSSNGDPLITPASSILSSAGLMGSLNTTLAGKTTQVTSPGGVTSATTSGMSNSIPARSGGAHLQRPHAIRTPSNAYAPFVARRPNQFPAGGSGPTRQRTSSVGRKHRSNPNAEYRAQEKAYMQRIRQDAQRAEADAEGGFMGNLSLNTSGVMDFSSDDGSANGGPGPDDVANGPGSPLSASAGAIGAAGEVLDEEFEQDTLLYYGNDEMQPTVEELKIPENRERIEWHTMLASVLTGDVVNQEKKRMIGSSDQPLRDETVKEELWLGLRARCYGRTLQAQRRNVERGRAEINGVIDSVIGFEVRGYSEAGGKNAAQQVEEIMKKIEKMESMYINHAALRAAHPRIGSPSFTASMSSSTAGLGGSSTSDQPTGYAASYEAILAWHNTMKLIEMELNVLRKWVGNDELNFSKASRNGHNSTSTTPGTESVPHHDRLADESSFVDRILKEEGLKTLQNHEGLLVGLSKVINQAKKTLITHADAFSIRHLPPYLEELQTLINFPSRLAKEIIRIRVSYAKKIKDLSTQPVMTTEQMIGQFQILLNLAIRIKDAYNKVSRPEAGWDPPDCLEENFDTVVVDALKFYFKLLNWKLTSNKNAFKEAEIMEQEWEFSTRVGRLLEGGDVEVAEQFRYVHRYDCKY
jgi:mitogen-activated protein kinase kinase kinase